MSRSRESEIENATECHELLQALTPAQALALDALDSGGTHQQAAALAGVDRTTVSRWMQGSGFRAELNRRRVERAERVGTFLMTTTIRALEVVFKAIDAGDARIAFDWLRLTRPSEFAQIFDQQTQPFPDPEEARKRLMQKLDEMQIRQEAADAFRRDQPDSPEATG